MLPFAKVGLDGPIELHLGAPGRGSAAADHQRRSVLTKQEGIPPLSDWSRCVRRLREDGISGVLVPSDQVVILRNGHPLLGLRLADARIEKARPAIGGNRGAARKDRSFTLILRGPDGDRQVLPIHQVAAARMSPMLAAEAGGEGIQLVEQVVPAAVVNSAVRIIGPIGRRMEVIHRPVRVGLGRRYGVEDGLRCLL